MTRPLGSTKIAVVVHNDVVSDARVLKEVASLSRAGAVVDVFGCRVKKDHEYPSTIPGARSLVLVDSSSHKAVSATIYNRRDKVLVSVVSKLKALEKPRKKTQNYKIIFGVIALIYITILTLTSALEVRLAMLMFAILAGLMYRLVIRHKKRVASKLSGKITPLVMPSYRYSRFHLIANALMSSINPEEYDAVHCHDLIALICGAQLKKQNPKLKLIWDAHEIYEHVAGYKKQDSKRTRKIIENNIGFADSIITISKSFSDYYEREFRVKRPFIVMNATVETNRPHYDGRLHAACGLRSDQKILLFQGGLAPHRGIGQLLEASAALPVDWSVVFMGSGKLAQKISDRASELEELRVPDRRLISLIPPAAHAELAEWTSGATLGIIPYENTSLNHLYCTPNKLWEYPNADVPILATDLVEVGDIIRKWNTGILLSRSFKALDIVQAVNRLSENKLNELRTACVQFSSSMSWTHFEDELYNAYR